VHSGERSWKKPSPYFRNERIQKEGVESEPLLLEISGLQRLQKNTFLWRSALLRASLRQSGGVISQRLMARLKPCPLQNNALELSFSATCSAPSQSGTIDTDYRNGVNKK